ncbi:MAG: sulfotransferase [Cyclobacteriaceae bacterium]
MNSCWKKHITSPIINYFGQRIAEKHFSQAPILIGGCGRSGTSLLLSILSAHSTVFAFPHEVDAHTSWIERDGTFVPERIDRLHRYLIKTKIPKNANRWCEKRPYNVRYIKQILSYYGTNCKIIHIVRDPRAVCTSYHPEKPDQYWVTIERWISDVSAGLLFENHPQVYTLKYEDLVLNTQLTLESLCRFLAIAYDHKIKDWLHYASITTNRAWFDELGEIRTESLHKWKKPEHHLHIQDILNHKEVPSLMKRLGYS